MGVSDEDGGGGRVDELELERLDALGSRSTQLHGALDHADGRRRVHAWHLGGRRDREWRHHFDSARRHHLGQVA